MAAKNPFTTKQKIILAAQRFFADLESDLSELFHPAGIAFGRGEKPIEVAVVASEWNPVPGELEKYWRDLRSKRGAPLVVVFLHNCYASTCGPDESEDGVPTVRLNLYPAEVKHACWAALRMASSETASQFLAHVLQEIEAK